MNLGKNSGLVRGHQFSFFPNMVLQGVVLGSILKNVGPKQKLIMNLCKTDGPAKVHNFPTFPNMVWQGVVLGAILGKVMPRRTP